MKYALLSDNAPLWTYWVTAIATALLAGGALWGLNQLRESRRARVTEIMAELSRRWDSDEMIKTRALVNAQRERLGSRIAELYGDKSEEYYQLLREPGYLEDIAILWKHKAVRLATIEESMGYIIPERWDVWSEAARFLRQERGGKVFERFEELAETLRHRT